MEHPILFAVEARVPAAGTADFAAYEDAVLPLLARHGGVLQRRVRNVAENGDWFELHLVAFESDAHFARYRDDPDRGRHADLLARSGAKMRSLPVEDVG